jgi:NNP family nitrate/nitrite transporter-like MFS transporter
VIGIRLVSEWFPANELGTAEGIYGGWGNFGSAAAAMSLPVLALFIGKTFGIEDAWRYAIALTGLMSLLFSFIWYANVTDTPKGATYFKPAQTGAMEVTSVGDFYLLLVMKLPMYGALALLTWKLSPQGVSLFSANMSMVAYISLVLLFIIEVRKTYQVN